MFNAGLGHSWAVLCPKDRRKASTLGDVSGTGFFNDFDFTTREGHDFITTIISFTPYSGPWPSLVVPHHHCNS